MRIIDTSLYLLAVAMKKHEHEDYTTWARTRSSKPVQLSDGLFTAYCSLPDGRVGRACVEATSAHAARTTIADHVARNRLAWEYGMDTAQSEAEWIAFLPADTDLFA